jgi:MFS family permease
MFLQSVHGLSPSSSGLHLMGLMVAVNGSALVSAQITARITHYKYPPMACLAVCIGACLYLALHADRISMLEFEVVMVLIGVGFGPVAPMTTVAMQNAVQLHQMGIAVAAVSFGRSLIATGLTAVYGVIVLGDLNDGPGLDEYEKLFGHSGVEISSRKRLQKCTIYNHRIWGIERSNQILPK